MLPPLSELPQVVINNKRGGGFKKAKGKGSVVLKCEAWWVDIGSGDVLGALGVSWERQRMQAAAPRCMWPSEWEGTLAGWKGLTLGRGCPNIVSYVPSCDRRVMLPPRIVEAHDFAESGASNQPAALPLGEGYLNERSSEAKLLLSPRYPAGMGLQELRCGLLLVGGMAKGLIFGKKAVEMERCCNAILR